MEDQADITSHRTGCQENNESRVEIASHHTGCQENNESQADITSHHTGCQENNESQADITSHHTGCQENNESQADITSHHTGCQENNESRVEIASHHTGSQENNESQADITSHHTGCQENNESQADITSHQTGCQENNESQADITSHHTGCQENNESQADITSHHTGCQENNESQADITSYHTGCQENNDEQTDKGQEDTGSAPRGSGNEDCDEDENEEETGNNIADKCEECDHWTVQPKESQARKHDQLSQMDWQSHDRCEHGSREKEQCNNASCSKDRIKKIEAMLNRENNTETLKENHERRHKRKKQTPDRKVQARKAHRKCSSPNHLAQHHQADEAAAASGFGSNAERPDETFADDALSNTEDNRDEGTGDSSPEAAGNEDAGLLRFAEILYKCSLCTTLPCILTSRSTFLSHVREHHLANKRGPGGIACQNCHLHFHTHTDLLVHISDWPHCHAGPDADPQPLRRQSPQENCAPTVVAHTPPQSSRAETLVQSQENPADVRSKRQSPRGVLPPPAAETPAHVVGQSCGKGDEDEGLADGLERRSLHVEIAGKGVGGNAETADRTVGDALPARARLKRRSDADSEEESKRSAKRRLCLADPGRSPPTTATTTTTTPLTTVEYHSSRHLNQLQLFTDHVAPSPPSLMNRQQRDPGGSGVVGGASRLIGGLSEGGVSGFPSFTPEFGRFTKLIREGGKIVYFCQVCNVKCQVKAAFQVHCNGVRHHNHVNMASKNKLRVASPDASYLPRDSSGRVPLREVALADPPQVTSLKGEGSFAGKLAHFFPGHPDVGGVLMRGKGHGAVTASHALAEIALLREPVCADWPERKDPARDPRSAGGKTHRAPSSPASLPFNIQPAAADPCKRAVGSAGAEGGGGLILQEVVWGSNSSRKPGDRPATDTYGYDAVGARTTREVGLSGKMEVDRVHDKDLYDLVHGAGQMGALHVETSAAAPMPDNSASSVLSPQHGVRHRSSPATFGDSDFRDVSEAAQQATSVPNVEVNCLHGSPKTAVDEPGSEQKRSSNRRDAQAIQPADGFLSIDEAKPAEDNDGVEPAEYPRCGSSQQSQLPASKRASERQGGFPNAGPDVPVSLVSRDKYRFPADHAAAGFHPSILSKSWFYESRAVVKEELMGSFDGLGGAVHDEDGVLEASKGPNNEGWKVTKIRDVLRGVLTASGKGSSVLRDVLLQRVSLELREPLVLYWGPACNRAVRDLFPHCLAQRKGKFKKTYFFGLCLLPGTEEMRGDDPVDCLNYRPLRDMTQDLEQLLEHLPGLLFWSGEVSHGVSRDEVLHVLAARLSESEVYHWGMQCNKALRILFPLVVMKRKGKYKTYNVFRGGLHTNSDKASADRFLIPSLPKTGHDVKLNKNSGNLSRMKTRHVNKRHGTSNPL